MATRGRLVATLWLCGLIFAAGCAPAGAGVAPAAGAGDSPTARPSAIAVTSGAPPFSSIALPSAKPLLSAGGDVVAYRGNPARTGEMPGPAPSGTPAVVWTFEAGAPIGSTPAVLDRVVYLLSN